MSAKNRVKRQGWTLSVFLACLAVWVMWPVPLHAATNDGSHEDVYDLVFEVKQGRKTLAPAMLGIEKDGKYYLPLQDLARLFRIKADIDKDAGRVTGFFVNEDRAYTLDLASQTVSANGEARTFSPDQTVIMDRGYGIYDVYVSPGLLNEIWPLAFSFNPLRQTLSLNEEARLPSQIAEDRARKRNIRLLDRERRDGEDPGTAAPDFPLLDNGYRLFSLPALNVMSMTRWESEDGTFEQDFNIQGRHDLLNMEAEYNVRLESDTEDGANIDNVRFLLSRRAYHPGDLPLGLNLVQVGDVRPQSQRLIGGSVSGRGILLSTESDAQDRNFDEIVVSGNAAPGWEVELYRNNELLDYQSVSEDGEYRFENVQLTFGKNKIRTILYGPQGQKEEKVKIYDISNSMLRPGQTIIEASLVEHETDLFENEEDKELREGRPKGLAQKYLIRRGINKFLSAFASFTGMPGSGQVNDEAEEREYASLGLNFSILGTLGSIEAYKELDGGTAFDLRAARKFFGTNLNLRAALLSDYESRYTGYGENAKTKTAEASISRTFRTPLGPLGLRFAGDYEEQEGGRKETDLTAAQNFGLFGARLTNTIDWKHVDGEHLNTKGRLNANYMINENWSLRGTAYYNVSPEYDLRNITAELRYKGDDGLTAAFDVNHNLLADDDATKLGAEIGYEFEKVRSSLDLDWLGDRGLNVMLRNNFSLAPYGPGGSYLMSGKNISGRAAVAGKVYLDKDYDGTFSPGDEPLQGATLNVSGRKGESSDPQGRALYTGGRSRNGYDTVTLAADSLGDPFRKPGVEGFTTTLRPGTAPSVEFPVMDTGIIDGEVLLESGEPLVGLTMQLVTPDGRIFAETRTAYDGFYTFEHIVPGSYFIRVDPSNDVLNVPPRHVLVTSETLFQDGMTFLVPEQASETEAAGKADADESGRITQLYRTHPASSGLTSPARNSNLQTGSGFSATAHQVRIGEHPGKARLVLDLSGPATYSLLSTDNGKSLSLRLNETGWDAATSWSAPAKRKETGIVRRYHVEMTGSATPSAILTLSSDAPVTVIEDKLLPPGEHSDHWRLYIDIRRSR